MNIYLVWHFTDEGKPQVQGIFDNEKLAKQCCEKGGFYVPMELNKIYKEDLNSEDTALYKLGEDSFEPYKEACIKFYS